MKLESLSRALLAAFPTQTKLAMMLKFKLGWNLDNISSEQTDLETTVFKLGEWCERQGRLNELLCRAMAMNPSNEALQRLFRETFPRVVYLCCDERDKCVGDLRDCLRDLQNQGVAVVTSGDRADEFAQHQAIGEATVAAIIISTNLLDSAQDRTSEFQALREHHDELLCVHADSSAFPASFEPALRRKPRAFPQIPDFRKKERPLHLLSDLEYPGVRREITKWIVDRLGDRSDERLRPPAAPAPAAEFNPLLWVMIEEQQGPPGQRVADPPCTVTAWLMGVGRTAQRLCRLQAAPRSGLRDLIDQLRDDALGKIDKKGGGEHRFPVELVLSRSLLNEDFDQWRMKRGPREEVLGEEHPVIVRPLERVQYRADDRASKYNRRPHGEAWQKLQQHGDTPVKVGGLDAPCCRFKAPCCRVVWLGTDALQTPALGAVLQDRQALGAVLPEPPSDAMFDELLRAGLPIALWARQGCEEHGLRTLFEDHPLKGIESRVMKARRQARYDQAAAHGRHLTLLWDDPERIPPNLLKLYNPK